MSIDHSNRAIILDTETTGLDPNTGDRLVEIGCLEIVNHMPTGHTYHQYINPEREVPIEAYKVHGLAYSFLKDFPVFKLVAQQFLDFIGDAPIIIHNAKFDMKFLNAELKTLGLPKIDNCRAVCTVEMAKRKFPGSRVSLDELCRRFKIDASNRTYHGALLDASLLAKVYLELMGGRQTGLDLARSAKVTNIADTVEQHINPVLAPRQFNINASEHELHTQLLAKLKNPLWNQFTTH